MKNKCIWIYLSILLTLFLGVSSCDKYTLLYQYQPIAGQIWNKTDTLDFICPEFPNDTTAQLHLCIRYKAKVQQKGVWIVLEQDFEHPQYKRRDTIYCQLTTDLGQPLGKGINHVAREYEAGNLLYHKNQKGKFRLYHIMHQDDIKGITDIGLLINVLPDSVQHQSAKR